MRAKCIGRRVLRRILACRIAMHRHMDRIEIVKTHKCIKDEPMPNQFQTVAAALIETLDKMNQQGQADKVRNALKTYNRRVKRLSQATIRRVRHFAVPSDMVWPEDDIVGEALNPENIHAMEEEDQLSDFEDNIDDHEGLMQQASIRLKALKKVQQYDKLKKQFESPYEKGRVVTKKYTDRFGDHDLSAFQGKDYSYEQFNAMDTMIGGEGRPMTMLNQGIRAAEMPQDKRRVWSRMCEKTVTKKRPTFPDDSFFMCESAKDARECMENCDVCYWHPDMKCKYRDKHRGDSRSPSPGTQYYDEFEQDE